MKYEVDDDRAWRLTSGLEVISILVSILIVLWGIAPQTPRLRLVMAIPLILSLALMIHSHWVRREGPALIGLTLNNFWRAVGLLLPPMVISATILIWIGVKSGRLQGADAILSGLLPLVVSGVAQQYLLQGFVHRRIRISIGSISRDGSVKTEPRLSATAAILTASCFALVHAPNLTLTILTFLAGLIWSLIYQKAPNIYAIGISHGLMSLLVINTLPSWMLHSLSVGYKHFLYRKF